MTDLQSVKVVKNQEELLVLLRKMYAKKYLRF